MALIENASTSPVQMNGREEQSADSILFGPFQLWPGKRRLEKDGVAVAIGGRAFDILSVLLEPPQQVITKRELVERVWPALIVDDSSLRGHISGLRRVLGDGNSDGRYIANVPGRGYC